MALTEYTRVGDFSDDEAANKGGRSSVDTAQLDAELDAIKAVTDEAGTLIAVLLRDDNKMQDDILEGHEFSDAALAVLATQLGTASVLVWRGAWANDTAYTAGNLVEDGGATYICVNTHTSPSAPTTFSAGTDWELVAAAGAATAFPAQSGNADKVLKTDGAAVSWTFITTANAPTLAPLASPTFTGTVTTDAIDVDGAMKTGKGSISTAATINIDFNGGPNQILSPLSNNLTTITTSNRSAASGEVKNVDLMIAADGSGPYTFAWPAGWKWVSDEPANIAANKSGVLSLRCYGANDTDVIACWAVEV